MGASLSASVLESTLANNGLLMKEIAGESSIAPENTALWEEILEELLGQPLPTAGLFFLYLLSKSSSIVSSSLTFNKPPAKQFTAGNPYVAALDRVANVFCRKLSTF